MNTITKKQEITENDVTNAAGKQIQILAGIARASAEIQQAINDIQDPELPTLNQDSYTLRRALNKLTNIEYILDQVTQDLTYETAENIAATIDTKRLR